jgi:hypothetical protein
VTATESAVAVIDAPAPFRTAVRGYDRAKVDALIRAEQAALQRCNERIAALEHHLAAARGAAFRVDDPARKQAIRAAADLLTDAWDHARQVITAEDATADLQRNHAASIAASHLADVNAWAEEQEQRARAEADALLAGARAEAEQLRAQATDFVANHIPMAEQLLADAAAESQEQALAAENEVHHWMQAIEADLTQRQTTADYDLQAAERLAAQAEQESATVIHRANRMCETGLARSRGIAEDLINSVASQIAALEADADRGLAELAEHMAALSTEVNSARKTIATRPALAPRTEPEPHSAPESAAVDPEATAPMPKAKATPRKATPSAPRTRRATPAVETVTEEAKDVATAAAEPMPEEAPDLAAPAACMPVVAKPLRTVTVVANGTPIVRL